MQFISEAKLIFCNAGFDVNVAQTMAEDLLEIEENWECIGDPAEAIRLAHEELSEIALSCGD